MQSITKIVLPLFITLLSVQPTIGQSGSGSAQKVEYQSEEHNYAMLIRNMNHLNAAIKTAQMLDDDDQHAITRFEVVICGKEVQNLHQHSKRICKARDHDIRVVACGMSMKKFGVNESSLPAGVDVVPNGLIRLFELQELGYQTISL